MIFYIIINEYEHLANCNDCLLQYRFLFALSYIFNCIENISGSLESLDAKMLKARGIGTLL